MNKINISDLSIGDWVRWEGSSENYRVCSIDGVSLTVELAEKLGGTIEVGIDEVVGVPITPEILEKNGFVQDPTFLKVYRQKLDIFKKFQANIVVDFYGIRRAPWGRVVSWPLGEDICECSRDESTMVPYMKFVHKLQRLYRLAGIEKEIEL